jgi:hypothetical protein
LWWPFGAAADELRSHIPLHLASHWRIIFSIFHSGAAQTHWTTAASSNTLGPGWPLFEIAHFLLIILILAVFAQERDAQYACVDQPIHCVIFPG